MKFDIYKAKVGLILPALNRVADRSEGIFLLALQVWMDFAYKQIRRDLTEKYIKKDVTTGLTDWEFIEEQGNEILKPATLKIMQRGGGQAYRILQAQVAFDVLNPNAVKAAGKITANFVRGVTQKTKEGIRSHIKAGVKAGKSMDKIAQDLKPLVGLTQQQVGAIGRYRQLLEEKRPDLSAAQVDKRINTLTNKTHRRRMKTIARTETARAQSVGYAVGLEDLGIDQIEFQIHPDDKTCDECSGMDGKKYKVGEGGGLIPVHPNCRCVLLPVIADTSTCRMAKRMEKATCIPPDSLHDEQIKDLLERLKVAPSAEGRKIRRALRRLGHKGGLGGKPPVGTPPTIKPTKPVVPKPKVKPEKIPDTAPKLEYKQLTEKPFSEKQLESLMELYGENPTSRQMEILLALTGEGTPYVFLTADGILRSAISLQQTVGKLTIRHVGSVYPKAGLRAMLKATEDAIKSKSSLYLESTKESIGFYRKLGYVETSPGIFNTPASKLLKIRNNIVGRLNKGIKPAVPKPVVRPKMKPHKLNEPNWKQQTAWENELTKKEKAIVHKWCQGGTRYQQLRYGEVGRKIPAYADIINPLPKKEMDKWIVHFKSALAKSPQYEGEVYRALGFGSKKTVVKNFKRGKTVEFKFTQSGTRSLKVAETFIDNADEMGEIAVQLRIKSKTSTYLGKLSLRDPSLKMHQEEVLLHAKTKYKVKSVKFIKNPDYFQGGYYDVVMVEL